MFDVRGLFCDDGWWFSTQPASSTSPRHFPHVPEYLFSRGERLHTVMILMTGGCTDIHTHTHGSTLKISCSGAELQTSGWKYISKNLGQTKDTGNKGLRWSVYRQYMYVYMYTEHHILLTVNSKSCTVIFQLHIKVLTSNFLLQIAGLTYTEGVDKITGTPDHVKI